MRDTGPKIENANFPPASQSPICRVSLLITISVSERIRLINSGPRLLLVIEKPHGVALSRRGSDRRRRSCLSTWD